MTGMLTKNSTNPINEYQRWFDYAKKHQVLHLKHASLATIDNAGYPHQRMMHILGVSDKGFLFATHTNTAKVTHMRENSKASLLFVWSVGNEHIQIKVTGEVKGKGLAKTRIKDTQNKAKFYEYELVPVSAQFAITDKSKDMVQTSYVHYVKDGKGQWKVDHSNYAYPKVKP
jgi:pyridoxine/pyridoxamine 5'-phosphate oxidase